jgi:hypothetical protein
MSNFDQLSQNASLEVNITTKEGFACGCTSTFVNFIGLGWFFHLSSLSLCLPSALCAWVLSYVYNHREFILSNLCSSAFVGGSLDPSSIAFTMSVSSLIIIEAGCKVLVSTSVEEYSEVIWTVDEEQHPDPDRVVLTGIVNAKAKRIAVLREKVTSLSSLQLALPPTVCSTNESQCQMMENMILHIHRPTGGPQAGFPLLDQWVRLPGVGGNSIMLTRRRGGDAHFPLVLFPNLGAHNLELWFHSAWYGRMFLLEEADAIKPCPAEQWWPFCAWCNKFHLPEAGPGCHRGSKKHQSFRLHQTGMTAEDLRLRLEDWLQSRL